MKKKRLQFSDEETTKFWNIIFQDSECLIEFGRLGSVGMWQTKKFASEEDAENAFYKLIEEKKAEGYQLVSEENDDDAATDRDQHAPSQQADSSPGPAPGKASAPTHPTSLTAATGKPPTALQLRQDPHSVDLPADPENVMAQIRLDAKDWFWAKWRNLSPLKLPLEQKFDQALEVKRLAKVGSKLITRVRWSSFDLPIKMSKEEAHFWLCAMTAEMRFSAKETAQQLKDRKFGDVTAAQIQQMTEYSAVQPEIMIPLFNLLPFEKLVEVLMTSQRGHTSQLAFGFAAYILPYLSAADRAALTQRIKPHLNPARLRERAHWHWAPPEFYLAAHLGMHDQVLAVVSTWEREADWSAFGDPAQIVYGLCDPTLVSKYIQLLNKFLALRTLPGWIAHTGFTGLDFVYRCVVADADTENCVDYFQILDLFPAPKIVHYVLQLHEIVGAKIRVHARKWMERNREVAIPFLIELAQRDKTQAKAAQEMLNNLNYQPAQFAESAVPVKTDQVDEPDVSLPPPARFDEVALTATSGAKSEGAAPDMLLTSIEAVGNDKKLKPIDWIRAANLPPIAVQQRKLSTEQIEAVLLALKASTLDSPHSLVTQLKNHANQSSLDAFVWDLFERWLDEDGPVKEKWAMASLGLLGSDKSALRLAPLIRKWPGESFHQRAIFGLECLERIGTDTAIMLINGIAQKLKYKPLQEKANACMNGIADARNMSREELEDRIVPDCDLNRQGTRVFDFGPRQFTLLIGGDLLPMVQDKDGMPKADLPKANASDDAAKAQEATEQWRLLKKQLKEILKIQAVRLEQAMIKQRRWSVPDFEGLLVQHPLLGHIVRRVIWLAFDADGQSIGTFRVTGAASAASGMHVVSESQSSPGSQTEFGVHYEDSLQAPFDLDRAAEVAIAHTMQFSEDDFRAWQTVLSRYPISPPFAQLNRQVYSLPAGTEFDTELTCFDDVFVSEETLVRTLESRGWTRGAAGDNGIFEEHTKVFACDKVTAVVQYDGVGMYAMGDEKQSIDRLFFLPGKQSKKISSQVYGAIPLGDIAQIVISEVLADLHFIASKGQVGTVKSD